MVCNTVIKLKNNNYKSFRICLIYKVKECTCRLVNFLLGLMWCLDGIDKVTKD